MTIDRASVEKAMRRAEGKAFPWGNAFCIALGRDWLRLVDEAQPGDMPHRCLNSDCDTTRYGTGYTACPRCGGTEGRAVLANPAAEEGDG